MATETLVDLVRRLAAEHVSAHGVETGEGSGRVGTGSCEKSEISEISSLGAPRLGLFSLNSLISHSERLGADVLERLAERAAIVEHDAGAPRSWAEGLARLDPDRPPVGIPQARWHQFVDDCGRFIDQGWTVQAASLGWSPLDLFGCDRDQPFARVERAGLLWQVNGDSIRALSRSIAIVGSRCNALPRRYRRLDRVVGSIVLPWELAA